MMMSRRRMRMRMRMTMAINIRGNLPTSVKLRHMNVSTV
jgi:hypothetical protein